MNRAAFALSLLEIHLNEWEPLTIDQQYVIKHRKNNNYIGSGKTLVAAIMKARDNEIKKLRIS